MVERIVAFGHENVTSRHKTTFEITKDKEITKKADCIIGVGSNKGLADLSEDFKIKAQSEDAVIEVVLFVNGEKETILGKGHPDLAFTHKTDIVIRKSEFICPRTLMIKADKSSRELNRRLINQLKDGNHKLVMEIGVK